MMAHRPKERRGAALLMVVACLSVLVLVFGVLLKIAMSEKAQCLSNERRLRAAWLAESGLERAWARLAETRTYSGESWTISPETLHGRDGALIQIVVDPIPGKPDRRRVTARADFPREGVSRARQTRVVEMNLSATGPGESR